MLRKLSFLFTFSTGSYTLPEPQQLSCRITIPAIDNYPSQHQEPSCAVPPARSPLGKEVGFCSLYDSSSLAVEVCDGRQALRCCGDCPFHRRGLYRAAQSARTGFTFPSLPHNCWLCYQSLNNAILFVLCACECYMCVGSIPRCIGGGQRDILGNRLSPAISMGIPGIQLRPSAILLGA